MTSSVPAAAPKVVATVPVTLPGTGAKTRVSAEVNAGGIGVHEFSVVLSPMADTHLDSSTYQGFGDDVERPVVVHDWRANQRRRIVGPEALGRVEAVSPTHFAYTAAAPND